MDDKALEGFEAQEALVFEEAVLKEIAKIPRGKVATYGQIAQLAEQPRAARQVGMILHRLSQGQADDLPWHQVINAKA
ncbi:MAG: MGMT family protein [Deinococcales bacterium]